jgi:lysophospholipase L1-like esterase
VNWLYSFAVLFLITKQVPEATNPPKGSKESLCEYQAPRILHLDSSYLYKFSLVDFDKNYFQFFTDESPNWEHFFDLYSDMKNRKQGKINFYHIGGSHLQADIYTHEVRTKMQTRNALLIGERGWVFPYDLARTNNPWSYEFSSPNRWERYRCVVPEHSREDFGLMGIKVVNRDSVSSMRFRYDKTKVKSDIHRIRVYHNKGFFPFDITWKDKDANLISEKRDEINGYSEFEFKYPFLSFEINFTRNIPNEYPLEIYGFELLNDYPGISYSSFGVNGASAYNFKDCKRFVEQLKVSPPDFFVFSLGTNDGNVPEASFDPLIYKSNLDTMIQRVLSVNPKCAILLTVPNDAYYLQTNLNPNIAKERLVIQELAVKYQCPVWDMYGIMGELGSAKTWNMSKLMQNDLVHFTVEGYHLKADLYFDAFEKMVYQFSQRRGETVKN